MDDKPTATTGQADNEIEALKQQIKILQQQLGDLEKGNGRLFEILKWGMGMFITFAVVFAGFNWWSGKLNYDRDREALKHESDLLAQGLSLSQKDSAASAKKDFEELRIANEKQLAVIRADVETNLVTMIAGHAKQLENAMFTFQSAATNLDSALTARFSEYQTQLRSVLTNLDATNTVAISNLFTAVNVGLADAKGISLLIQGNYMCKDNRSKTPDSCAIMVGGLSSLATGCIQLINASEEHNFESGLRQIVKYYPVLINNSPRDCLFPADDMYNLGRTVDSLVTAIRQNNTSGRYDGMASEIQSLNTIYKKVVVESRVGRVGGVKVQNE